MKNHEYYDRPVRIEEGIYWVGFFEEKTNLHCNPYLVVEGDEAVLIDAGSRPDFAVVMMKILQTGIDPKQIVALIYQHYDPDLCGSMPNMIDICGNENLRIISETTNKIFIKHYIERGKQDLLETIDERGYLFTFNSRTLQFFKTPYAHTAGSFVTYDAKTKTLFSSDLFGSFSAKWDIFLQFDDECIICNDYDNCKSGKDYCSLLDIIAFHRTIMPCEKSLRHAMNIIKNLDINIIAPQHGSVLPSRRDVYFLLNRLECLEGVGIDSTA